MSKYVTCAEKLWFTNLAACGYYGMESRTLVSMIHTVETCVGDSRKFSDVLDLRGGAMTIEGLR